MVDTFLFNTVSNFEKDNTLSYGSLLVWYLLQSCISTVPMAILFWDKHFENTKFQVQCS